MKTAIQSAIHSPKKFFWWQNWVHYGIHAHSTPWYVVKHVQVDAKSENASESQNKVKGQLSAK